MTQLTPSQLAGLTYSAADILEGSASSAGGGTYTFTTQARGSQLGANATFSFSNPNDAAGTITVTINGTGTFYDGSTLTATLLANDSSDFLLSGSFPPFYGYALVANTAFNSTTGAGGTMYNVQALGPSNTYTPPTTACFAGGTRIRTPTGDVPVETLCEGDLVLTHDGTARPIVWVGARVLRGLRRQGRPERTQPIRIAAGAFRDVLGQSLPEQDLIVSPDHALYLDGHLIPAKALLNGATVTQLDQDVVVYHHIELDTHAILLAEGMPAESYLDTGNRGSFASLGATRLHPEFGRTDRAASGCAPFVEDGPIVERIRAAMLAAAGLALTHDAAMTITFDPDGARLRSRSDVAGELSADPRDRRRLGVKLASLRIAGRLVPLDHPLLTEGWHAVEPDGRWTDGGALVPRSLLAGSTDVVVELAATARYRIAA